MDEQKPFDELLLLDDDEDDYVLIKSLLHGAFGDSVKLDWYQKDGVANEMICSGLYRVTMVDYRLGHENGLDVIRKAKAQCPDQVVFLVTDWDYYVSSEGAKQAGANGYLKKSELSAESFKKALSPFLKIDI
jgi:ActR/RegA family two-component response regulator